MASDWPLLCDIGTYPLSTCEEIANRTGRNVGSIYRRVRGYRDEGLVMAETGTNERRPYVPGEAAAGGNGRQIRRGGQIDIAPNLLWLTTKAARLAQPHADSPLTGWDSKSRLTIDHDRILTISHYALHSAFGVRDWAQGREAEAETVKLGRQTVRFYPDGFGIVDGAVPAWIEITNGTPSSEDGVDDAEAKVPRYIELLKRDGTSKALFIFSRKAAAAKFIANVAERHGVINGLLVTYIDSLKANPAGSIWVQTKDFDRRTYTLFEGTLTIKAIEP